MDSINKIKRTDAKRNSKEAGYTSSRKFSIFNFLLVILFVGFVIFMSAFIAGYEKDKPEKIENSASVNEPTVEAGSKLPNRIHASEIGGSSLGVGTDLVLLIHK